MTSLQSRNTNTNRIITLDGVQYKLCRVIDQTATNIHHILSQKQHQKYDVQNPINKMKVKIYRHDIFKGGDYASGDVADYAAYQTAVQQGKAITLANVMKSADSQSKMFYVPQGYYYVGANGDLAPKLNSAFVADTGNALTTPAATAGDDDTMLYLFLAALGVIAVGVVMKRKNKKKR